MSYDYDLNNLTNAYNLILKKLKSEVFYFQLID